MWQMNDKVRIGIHPDIVSTTSGFVDMWFGNDAHIPMISKKVNIIN